MFKNSIYFLSLICLVVVSCDKFNDDKDLVAENWNWKYVDTASTAQVKFMHVFAANSPTLASASSSTQGPQVFLYLNNKRLNGTSLSYSGTWPSTTSYAAVNAGTQPLQVVMARLKFVVSGDPAPIAGDTLVNTTVNLNAGKKYSIFLVDTLPTMKTLVVNDDHAIASVNKYSLRFINLTANPLDTFDVYSRRVGSVIFSGVKNKQVADFIDIIVPPIQDTFDFRRPNTTATLFSTNFQPISQRAYTLITRGRTGLTGKTTSATFYTNR
jgi:hypothetical protein